jgi:hypothetical protein
MRKSLFILLLPLLAAGCAHTVGYRLTAVDRWNGPRIEGTVCVQPFADATVPIIKEEETTNDGVWRTNYRKHYSSTNLSSQVTAMIAKHLAYSGLFTKAIGSPNTNADWFLSGTLSNYEVRGRINYTAENVQAVSAGFGLLGGLVGYAATAKMTSEIKTQVTLKNLNLTDKAGRSVWHDSIFIDTDTNMDFQCAGPGAIFFLPDLALEKAVNKMIQGMANSLGTNQPGAVPHVSMIAPGRSSVSNSSSRAAHPDLTGLPVVRQRD